MLSGGGDWMQEEKAEGRGVFHDKALNCGFFFVYLLCSDTSVKKIWGFLCGIYKVNGAQSSAFRRRSGVFTRRVRAKGITRKRNSR
jgi:hypothetical protein